MGRRTHRIEINYNILLTMHSNMGKNIFLIILFCITVTSSFGQLVFDTTIINDTVNSDLESYRFTFRFINKSNKPIKIVEIKKTCACTIAENDKLLYKENEVGCIKGEFYIEDRKGLQIKDITVYTDDTSQSQIKLRLKIKILADYEISPRLIYWDKDGECTAKEATLNINNPNWDLKDIKYDKSKFMVETSKDDGKHTIKVTPLSTNISLRDLIKVELKNKDNAIKFLVVHVLIK